MSFARRILLTLGISYSVRRPGAASLPAQAAPAPTATPTAQSQPAPAQPTAQAYSLPADKLAKAIALSRIRSILDITGSIWGLVFLWLLLATRAAAALAGWAERLLSRRWMQGLLFFAVFSHYQHAGRACPSIFSATISAAATASACRAGAVGRGTRPRRWAFPF